jgi:hypothetical protein
MRTIASHRRTAVAVSIAAIAIACMVVSGCDYGGPRFGVNPGIERVPTPANPTAPAQGSGGEQQMVDATNARVVFDNWNVGGVENEGESPSVTLASAVTVTAISTYHFNNGTGATPGTVSLKAADGTVYGPWPCTGGEAQGGVANGIWNAKPNASVPAGTYTVIDSDPPSWSQNAESGGKGFTSISGVVGQ